MVEGSLGYQSFEYADSLSEFGIPRYLPRCKGWILERRIDGSPYWDGMGPYPLFCCERPDYLAEDLRALKNLVSVTLVLDLTPSEAALESAFDRYKEFKTFYVVNRVKEYKPVRHHARYAKKATKDGVEIYRLGNEDHALGSWVAMYQNLISKHGITGIQAFSTKSFVKQFTVPGLNVFVAEYEGKTVGMLLFFDHGDRVYYHLGASSDQGYKLHASFALMDYAIRSFEGKTIILGGASGNQDSDDGLAQFKAGWANETRHSLLCETVNQAKVYEMLALGRTDYYPAYRGK